jgi:hypothetical protein
VDDDVKCEARPFGLLFPIGPHVDVTVTRRALRAYGLASKQQHFGIIGKFRHVDQRGVSARWVQAIGDEALNAQVAHVAERHRRTA